MVIPPSMFKTCPVAYGIFPVASAATADPRSSGVPHRCSNANPSLNNWSYFSTTPAVMSVRNVLWICVLQLFGAERPRPQQKHTVEETLVDGLYGSVNKWSSSLGVDKGWRNFRTNEVVFSSPCIHEHVALNFSSYPFIVLVEPGGVEMFVT